MDVALCLYRKYRPKKFSELVGQTVVKSTLQNAVKTGRMSHAYLFSGPRGTGKTTAARLLGKAINCLSLHDGEPCCKCENCLAVDDGTFLDLIEIDAASNSLIDDIRDLREKVRYAPARGRYKVYIVDEAHQLRGAAAHAFLKTLEEPPPHVMFVLATTEPHKFLDTILSRCQQFDFKRIGVPDIVGRLREIADAEKIDVTNECLALIARGSDGGMRDAISLMDQVESFEGKRIALETVEELLGTVREEVCSKMMMAIAEGEREQLLEQVDRLLASGRDPYQLVVALSEHVRRMIRAKLGVETEGFYTGNNKTADVFTVSRLTEIMGLLFNCLRDMRVTREEIVALDLVFMELFQAKAEPSSAGGAKKQPAEAPAAVSAAVLPPAPTQREKSVKVVSKKVIASPEKTAKKPPGSEQPAPIKKPKRRENLPLQELAAKLGKELDESSAGIEDEDGVQDAVSRSEEEILRLSHEQPELTSPAPAAPAAEQEDKKRVVPQLMEELKAANKPMIHALLKESIGEKVIGETVHIYFSDKYRFHVEKLKDDSNRLILQNLAGKILGGSYRVEPEIKTKKAAGAGKQVKETEAIDDELIDHPTVKQVQKLFGGTIVEIKED